VLSGPLLFKDSDKTLKRRGPDNTEDTKGAIRNLKKKRNRQHTRYQRAFRILN
jgi:hypothetical protein